jgi:hypothetical protein
MLGNGPVLAMSAKPMIDQAHQTRAERTADTPSLRNARFTSHFSTTYFAIQPSEFEDKPLIASFYLNVAAQKVENPTGWC